MRFALTLLGLFAVVSAPTYLWWENPAACGLTCALMELPASSHAHLHGGAASRFSLLTTKMPTVLESSLRLGLP